MSHPVLKVRTECQDTPPDEGLSSSSWVSTSGKMTSLAISSDADTSQTLHRLHESTSSSGTVSPDTTLSPSTVSGRAASQTLQTVCGPSSIFENSLVTTVISTETSSGRSSTSSSGTVSPDTTLSTPTALGSAASQTLQTVCGPSSIFENSLVTTVISLSTEPSSGRSSTSSSGTVSPDTSSSTYTVLGGAASQILCGQTVCGPSSIFEKSLVTTISTETPSGRSSASSSETVSPDTKLTTSTASGRAASQTLQTVCGPSSIFENSLVTTVISTETSSGRSSTSSYGTVQPDTGLSTSTALGRAASQTLQTVSGPSTIFEKNPVTTISTETSSGRSSSQIQVPVHMLSPGITRPDTKSLSVSSNAVRKQTKHAPIYPRPDVVHPIVVQNCYPSAAVAPAQLSQLYTSVPLPVGNVVNRNVLLAVPVMFRQPESQLQVGASLTGNFIGIEQEPDKSKSGISPEYFIGQESGLVKIKGKSGFSLVNRIADPNVDDEVETDSVGSVTVMSVAERIELELQKLMNDETSSNDAKTKGGSDVSLPVVNKFNNPAVSVSKRIDMEIRKIQNITFLKEYEEKQKAKKEKALKRAKPKKLKKKEGNSQIVKSSQMGKSHEGKSTEVIFTTENLYALLIEEKSPSAYICRNCSHVFSNKDDAMDHADTHNTLKCVSCDVAFVTLGDMKVHYRVDHKERFHCTYCLFSTDVSLKQIETHIRTNHRPAQPRTMRTFDNKMVCYICGLIFFVWERIDYHLEKEHGIEKTLTEGDFLCPVCNEILRNEVIFRHHLRKHRGNYIHCSEPNCDYKSLDAGLVKKHHFYVHIGERMYRCPFEGCETSFKRNIKIEEHLNMVHYKIPKYFCDTCGKGFFAQKHLSVHERIHSDEKPVACKLCDYRCRQTASLKWHMKRSHPETVDATPSSVSTRENQLKRGRKATGRKAKNQKAENGKKKPSKKRRRSELDLDDDDDDDCDSWPMMDLDSGVDWERESEDGLVSQMLTLDGDTNSDPGSTLEETTYVRKSSRKRSRTEN